MELDMFPKIRSLLVWPSALEEWFFTLALALYKLPQLLMVIPYM